MKISVTTIGCKLNFSESATIIRQFVNSGKYELVDFGEEADVTIINSCSVTAQAERKSRYATKKAVKVSPNGIVAVIGCSAQLRPESFEKIDGVNYVLGTETKFELWNLLEKKDSNKIHSCEIENIEKFDNAFSVSERTRSFLKIQDGCDYHCAYCTIPKARGKSRNGTIVDIIKKAEIIAKNGIKEIILTGVNIGDFGKTTGETFYQLLEKLVEVKGIERIRISSIEPNLLTDEILELVKFSDKIMPHFHIPLQNGSDAKLKMMKRRYNTKFFREKILKIHELIPDAFIGIDVIVGFPTETEENFNETYNLLESLPISFLHIFPYSDRPGTDASKIYPKVPSEWIKEREIKLKELSDQKHQNFYKKYIGQTRKVLFEATSHDKFITGFTDNYLLVKVDKNLVSKNSIKPIQLKKLGKEFFYGGQ